MLLLQREQHGRQHRLQHKRQNLRPVLVLTLVQLLWRLVVLVVVLVVQCHRYLQECTTLRLDLMDKCSTTATVTSFKEIKKPTGKTIIRKIFNRRKKKTKEKNVQHILNAIQDGNDFNDDLLEALAFHVHRITSTATTVTTSIAIIMMVVGFDVVYEIEVTAVTVVAVVEVWEHQ